MKKCEMCGGVFTEEECPFGKVVELPWAEDYVQMKQGKLDHAEHQRNVARWVLHGEEEHAESIVLWAKKMVLEEKL